MIKDDKRWRLENEGQQLWWIGQGLPATFEIWLFQVLANADGHVGESKSKTCSLLNNSAAFRIWGYTGPCACACAVFHSHWYRFGWPGRVLECWSNWPRTFYRDLFQVYDALDLSVSIFMTHSDSTCLFQSYLVYACTLPYKLYDSYMVLIFYAYMRILF